MIEFLSNYAHGHYNDIIEICFWAFAAFYAGSLLVAAMYREVSRERVFAPLADDAFSHRNRLLK